MTSLRILIQLAAQYGMCIHQLDVKTAYLNALIDCETYVEQPEVNIDSKWFYPVISKFMCLYTKLKGCNRYFVSVGG